MIFLRRSALAAVIAVVGCSGTPSSAPPNDAAAEDGAVVTDAASSDSKDAGSSADTPPDVKDRACMGHASAGAPLTITDIQALDISHSAYESVAAFRTSKDGRFLASPSSDGADLGLGKLATTNPADLVIARFDGKTPSWNVASTGPGFEAAHALSFTSSGALIIGGQFGAGTDFGGKTMTLLGKTVDAEEYSDGFVAKIGLDGTLGWLTVLGDQGAQEVRSVTLDARDHAFVTVSNNFSTLVLSSGKSARGNAIAAELGADGSVLWMRGTGDDGSPAGALPQTDGTTWFFAGIYDGNYVTLGTTKQLKGTVRYTIDATGAEVSSMTYEAIAMRRVQPSPAGGYVFVASVLQSTTIAGTVIDPASADGAIGALDAAGAITWIRPLRAMSVRDLSVGDDGTIAVIGNVASTKATTLGDLQVSTTNGVYVARLAKDGSSPSLVSWGCTSARSIGFEQDGSMTAVVIAGGRTAFDATHVGDYPRTALVTLRAP